MPARREPLDGVWTELGARGLNSIVCLAPLEEIERKSPSYALALRNHAFPCEVRSFAIPDYSAPDEAVAFWQFAHELAAALEQGKTILVHCGAGVGRTGTMGGARFDAERRVEGS